ncbi:MAG TPA: NAD(P)/FAD-dependent oxidoreductase [Phototrophicaceae bacterium]|nr:NAD(P)/FAD-dependent oxidoreductase [Phototrophicaceae bacterium]
MPEYDAVIVGSGPNGLAAAITVARQGGKVLVIEGKDTLGGGLRSAELTLPGFVHDICSAIHPLTAASPFFKTLPLSEFGLDWIEPPAQLAHVLDGAQAVLIRRSLEETAAQLGGDERAYRTMFGWLTEHCDELLDDFLGPLPIPPRHPLLMARFGLSALLPAASLAKLRFKTEQARALFGGMACHSIMPLEWPATAAFGLMLGMTAHKVGWVFPRGGAQKIADALAGYLRSLGGEIVTGQMITSLNDLPPARAIFLDITPRQIVQIAGDRLPPRYRHQLENYRYGLGVFKIDYALSAPIPWTNPLVAQSATVHLGGTLDELAASERAAWSGQHSERPFVLLAQHSLFDPMRAPAGKHTVWAYCHVPNGSTVDMTERIEAQIERFAPGFRDLIIARSSRSAQAMEAYNPNYIGGDINGGVQDLRQLFTRPTLRLNPYSTPLKNVYICSSSTPPGGGVHGMCGYHAAKSAGF